MIGSYYAQSSFFSPAASILSFPLSEPNLPRKIPSEKMTEEDIADTRQREILTFNVPLNATEAAGLGISVKGKTTTGPHGSQDLGIFIKSIIQVGTSGK